MAELDHDDAGDALGLFGLGGPGHLEVAAHRVADEAAAEAEAVDERVEVEVRPDRLDDLAELVVEVLNARRVEALDLLADLQETVDRQVEVIRLLDHRDERLRVLAALDLGLDLAEDDDVLAAQVVDQRFGGAGVELLEGAGDERVAFAEHVDVSSAVLTENLEFTQEIHDELCPFLLAGPELGVKKLV